MRLTLFHSSLSGHARSSDTSFGNATGGDSTSKSGAEHARRRRLKCVVWQAGGYWRRGGGEEVARG